MRGRISVGLAVLAITVAGLPGLASAEPEAAAPAPAEVAAVAPVNWGACDPALLTGIPPEDVFRFSCALYRVPIDHDRPALGTIDIAMMRRAATNPAAKIGSLFINPGGPGGSGLQWPKSGRFQDEVRDRFDLIGFDPRGVGRSNPLRCFTTQEDADEIFRRQIGVPLTRPEITDTLASYRDYGQFCKRNAGSLLHHMSTRDVVRDLDLMRAGVGDQQFNFVGFSYGTLIGATYANMFPRKVRSMVLDGNVDPALRTSDGLQYDRERAQGFEIALNAMLAECKRVGPQCAFSAGDPRKKFDELREYLRRQPIVLPDGDTINISQFTGGVSSALYRPPFNALARDLQTLYNVIHPEPGVLSAPELGALLEPGVNPMADVNPDAPYTSDDSYFAVNCSDKEFNHPQALVPAIAQRWERESPTFGRSQAFSDAAACPAWPEDNSGAYKRPWNRTTPNPLLVVGNYYDPATQYEFSRRMANQLGSARLLAVDAFGHCILGDSKGVDDAATRYLVDLVVPPPGQVYQPNRAPF